MRSQTIQAFDCQHTCWRQKQTVCLERWGPRCTARSAQRLPVVCRRSSGGRSSGGGGSGGENRNKCVSLCAFLQVTSRCVCQARIYACCLRTAVRLTPGAWGLQPAQPEGAEL